MRPRTIGKIQYRNETLLVERASYDHGGRTAIVILGADGIPAEQRKPDEHPGEVEAVLSVNTDPVGTVGHGEFVVPTYKLPHSLLQAAMATGLFEDTGREVVVGFAGPQPVWRLTEAAVSA